MSNNDERSKKQPYNNRPDSLPSLLKSIKASTSLSNLNIPDDIDDPNSTAYGQLLSLTTQSLDDLRSQPATLSSAKTSLESQLSSLCSRHVSSFVRVHSASSSLPNTLDKLDLQLENLIEFALPTLSHAAQQFPQQVEQSILIRNRARNLLTQYDTSLKDLLDIPQILMTCAKANHPIEALQLGTHMAKLAKADYENGNKSAIIKALKRECWTHLIRLREDLLRGLGSRGVRLPAARRYVSLLQRLYDIDEAARFGEVEDQNPAESSKLAISNSAICLSFLRSRWVLVEELGAHDDSTDPSNLLPEQISSWRDLVGETCNIAMALFGDKEGKGELLTSDNSNDQMNDALSPLSLISSFGYRSVDKLEQLVSRAVGSIDGRHSSSRDAFETLATLHTQLSYSAASLSRQGLDFSIMSGTRTVFERQALQLWTSGIRSNIAKFENLLNHNNILSAKDLLGSEDAQSVLIKVNLESIQSSKDWSSQVAQFPYLTSLANGFLDEYESLISFAPISIGKEALKTFEFAVGDLLSQMLESFKKAELDLSSTSTEIILPPLLKDMRDEEHGMGKRRKHEAIMAITARFLITLSGSLVPAIRQTILNLFQQQQDDTMTPSLDSEIRNTLVWANEIEQKWQNGEQTRKSKLEQMEKERLAAEEEERKKIEQERKKRQEEEKERIRLAEERRIREEEANKKRLEEQKRRLEEEKKRQEEESKRQAEVQKKREEELQRAEEEKKRLAEEEEKEQKRLAEEKEQKRLAEEKEQKRLAEEKEQKRLAEEKEQKRLAEEKEQKRLAEEKEQKRLAEEKEQKRLAEEKEKRLAEEERKRLLEEEKEKQRMKEEEEENERAKVKEEKKRAEEEAKKIEEEKQKAESEKREKEDKEKQVLSSSAMNEEESPQSSDQQEMGSRPKGDETKEEDAVQEGKTKEIKADDVKDAEVEKEHEPAEVSKADKILVNPTSQSQDVQEEEKEGNKASAKEISEEQNIDSSSNITKQKDESEQKTEESEKVEKKPTKANNKLAEKLRKRQEERERAAAAASASAAETK